MSKQAPRKDQILEVYTRLESELGRRPNSEEIRNDIGDEKLSRANIDTALWSMRKEGRLPKVERRSSSSGREAGTGAAKQKAPPARAARVAKPGPALAIRSLVKPVRAVKFTAPAGSLLEQLRSELASLSRRKMAIETLLGEYEPA